MKTIERSAAKPRKAEREFAKVAWMIDDVLAVGRRDGLLISERRAEQLLEGVEWQLIGRSIPDGWEILGAAVAEAGFKQSKRGPDPENFPDFG